MPRELIDAPIESFVLGPQTREASGLDEESLASLAQSIKQSGGVHQPLLVRPKGKLLEVLDGGRRLRAGSLAKLASLPAVVDDSPLSDEEVIERQLLLDAQRVDLNPVERARALAGLLDNKQLTGDQAAKRLGISPSQVSRSLALLKLPAAILAHVSAGRITADAAYMLSRVEDAAEQTRLAEQVTEGLLTRDALSRKFKRARRANEANRGRGGRVTAMLGGGKAITFAGDALTLDSVMECLEQLLTRAKKARTQGLSLQTFVRALKDQAAGKGES